MFNFDRLNELSKEKGISKSFICKKLGKSRSFFVDAAKGKCSVSDNDIYIIANVLDTTPEYLTGKTDIKNKLTTQLDDELTALLQEPSAKQFASLLDQLTKDELEYLLDVGQKLVALRKK